MSDELKGKAERYTEAGGGPKQGRGSAGRQDHPKSRLRRSLLLLLVTGSATQTRRKKATKIHLHYRRITGGGQLRRKGPAWGTSLPNYGHGRNRKPPAFTNGRNISRTKTGREHTESNLQECRPETTIWWVAQRREESKL